MLLGKICNMYTQHCAVQIFPRSRVGIDLRPKPIQCCTSSKECVRNFVFGSIRIARSNRNDSFSSILVFKVLSSHPFQKQVQAASQETTQPVIDCSSLKLELQLDSLAKKFSPIQPNGQKTSSANQLQ